MDITDDAVTKSEAAHEIAKAAGIEREVVIVSAALIHSLALTLIQYV